MDIERIRTARYKRLKTIENFTRQRLDESEAARCVCSRAPLCDAFGNRRAVFASVSVQRKLCGVLVAWRLFTSSCLTLFLLPCSLLCFDDKSFWASSPGRES